MNIGFAKVAVVVSLLAYIIIRWPHGNRSRTVALVENRKGSREVLLLIGATLGTTVIPIIWVASGLLGFADYPLHPVPYAVGLVVVVVGLWLFYRSHADLGTNWSVTLQMRDDHHLVMSGVYSKIRHPMYASMFLLGIAQILFLPNWIAAPAYLISFGLLYVLRVKVEEHMMLDRFGSEYEAYMRRSERLIPRFGDDLQGE